MNDAEKMLRMLKDKGRERARAIDEELIIGICRLRGKEHRRLPRNSEEEFIWLAEMSLLDRLRSETKGHDNELDGLAQKVFVAVRYSGLLVSELLPVVAWRSERRQAIKALKKIAKRLQVR